MPTDNNGQELASMSEPQRKGRGNAILTYEKVEQIVLSVQKVDLKLDNLEEKMDLQGRQHDDHELRIRVLELAYAGSSHTATSYRWLYGAIWPLVMFLIAMADKIFSHLGS